MPPPPLHVAMPSTMRETGQLRSFFAANLAHGRNPRPLEIEPFLMRPRVLEGAASRPRGGPLRARSRLPVSLSVPRVFPPEYGPFLLARIRPPASTGPFPRAHPVEP